MDVQVKVDEESLRRLVTALNAESDGKALKRDLARNLRAATEPAIRRAQVNVMAMPSGGDIDPGGGPVSLRVAVATGVKARVSLRGFVSVAISAKKIGMPRDFRNAPKRLNSAKGWRHPVFGTKKWVRQLGRPRWFDDAMDDQGPEVRVAVTRAVQDMVRRLSAIAQSYISH